MLHHLHGGVLQGGGAVALEALQRLVGHPLAADLNGRDVLALVRQQDLVADLRAGRRRGIVRLLGGHWDAQCSGHGT